MDKLLNIEEVAEILCVKPATIYGWVSEGYIPHIKLGRLVRFDKVEVIDWVQNHKVKGRKTRLSEKDPLCSASK